MTTEMMGTDEKIAILARAILALAERSAHTWDYDGEIMIGEGVQLPFDIEETLRALSALTSSKPEQAVRPSLGIVGYRLLAPGELDAETVERCIKELNKLPWFEDVVSLVDVEAALRALEAQGGPR